MILVDALYICHSGGKKLLEILLDQLSDKNGEVITVLIDKRIKTNNLNPHNNSIQIIILKSSELNRSKYYIKNRHLFRKVFCLANVPPPINLDCQVMIYFQNVLLLDRDLQKTFSLFDRLLLRLKEFLIKNRAKSNQEWIVQTKNIESLLVKTLNLKRSNIYIYPFFEDISPLRKLGYSIDNKDFFYPSTGANHKNHLRLLSCWEKLYFKEKVKVTLHLTIDKNGNKLLIQKIKTLQALGVPIVNHGYLSKEKINRLYMDSKFVIHPSLGESFGLVLIEALQNKCVLLAPDLPYVKAIVTPHYFFDPYNIDSIKESVLQAIQNEESLSPAILVENKIGDLIKHILI